MHDTISLSPHGQQRRDAMRAQLVGAVRQRRQRRLLRRAAAATLLLSVCAWLCWPATPDLPSTPSTHVASASDPPSPSPLARVQVLDNDPTVLMRCTIAAGPTTVQFLDDDTLLAQLQHAGRHAAIARSAGRIALPRDVADDWTVAP